jgi:hypothetical protein
MPVVAFAVWTYAAPLGAAGFASRAALLTVLPMALAVAFVLRSVMLTQFLGRVQGLCRTAGT